MHKAILMANVDYNSTMDLNRESFAFDPVQNRAKRLGISEPEQFDFDVYRNNIITSVSAEKLRVLHALNDEELYSKVLSFMEENYSSLKNEDNNTFIKATYLRVFTIQKQGSTLNDITKMLYEGYGCLLPIMMYIEGKTIKFYAFFTMGTPTLAQVGIIPRQLCPGMSNKFHGSRFNTSHPIKFPSNLLISVTHFVAINTRSILNISNRIVKNISEEEIDYYTAMTIGKDGGELLRVVRRIYERVRMEKHLVVILIHISGKKNLNIDLFIYMLPHVKLEQHHMKIFSVTYVMRIRTWTM